MESCTTLEDYKCTMHKILKNDRRHFGEKPVFLFLCPESISKVDLADIFLFDGLYIGQYYEKFCSVS